MVSSNLETSIEGDELNFQPDDVVKVLESAALGYVEARVIRVKSGYRVVVQIYSSVTVLQINKFF